MAKVELIYITQDKQVIHHTLDFTQGLRVADIISKSNIWNTHPETKTLPLGIFSKPTSLDTLVKPGDRVEIYRALTFDPKEIRRKKAKLKK
mgnify:CR=1 FL=1